MLNKGKPSREHTYPAIRAALVRLLHAWGSPFVLADIPQGCRIQATACDITGRWAAGWVAGAPAGCLPGGLAGSITRACRQALAGRHQRARLLQPSRHIPPACPTPNPRPAGWLHSPEADRALSAFNARADGGRAPLAKEVFFQQDAGAEARCAEAFAAVRHFEACYCVADSALPPAYLGAREDWVATCISFSALFGLKDEVLHDGVLLLDRAVAAGGDQLLSLNAAALVVSCLLISARQGETGGRSRGGVCGGGGGSEDDSKRWAGPGM